uniref:G-protein coupled receptors family 2 profile 2 domain-containing protein n=1 Tax=Arcella intermedia TaxID=1963864 RepID=A0A6B2LDQ2_9EUKA
MCDYFWALVRLFTFVSTILYPPMNTFFICILNRILFQIFAGSSICWAACISFYLYIVLRQEQDKGNQWHSHGETFNRLWKYFCLFSLGLPVALAIVILSIPNSMEKISLFCYPRPVYRGMLWFIPLFSIYIISIVIYFSLFFQHRSNFSLLVKHKLPFRISLYVVVFLTCWSLDGILFAINFSGYCTSWHLLLASYTLVHSQGFFDFLVYGTTNPGMNRYLLGLDRRKYLVLPFLPLIVWIVAFPKFVKRKCNDRNSELIDVS